MYSSLICVNIMSELYITQLSLINDLFNAISLMFFHEKRTLGLSVLGCCLIGVLSRYALMMPKKLYFL